MEKKNIYICATMDTKGEEAVFLKEQIEACGNNGIIIDGSRRKCDKGYLSTIRRNRSPRLP